MSRAARALAAGALALAAGCAGLTQQAGPAEFELSGRIAVRYRDEGSTGNLAWRHAASSDEMLLTNSLGQGVARLQRADGVIVLTASDGREYRAADAEALTEEVLGFRVPLEGMAQWVRGRPAPALEAAGWKVEYQEYDAERRPKRLRLTYPGLEIRLAISAWK